MSTNDHGGNNARLHRRILLAGVAACWLYAPGTAGLAQQTTGTPGSPSATTTIDGKYLPPPPPKFGGVINLQANQSKPYWPPHVVPPKGAPNVLLIMTDDQGYGVSGTFGGVIPTPAMDRIAQIGAALHPVPLHGAVLADAGGADHRPQPPLGGLRRHLRAVHRLPGLRLRHRPGERHHRHDPEAERLRHVLVRQEPQHAELSVQRSRAVRPMADRHGLRVFLRLHGRRDRPVDAVPVPEHDPDFSLGREARLQPHHRHGGRGHRPHAAAQRGRARQAVLRLLRARRHPFAAPADAGVDRQVHDGNCSTWAGTSCASRSSPTRSGSA